jgi:hypothetical protein
MNTKQPNPPLAPWRHVGSVTLLSLSLIFSMAALGSWAADEAIGPWAPGTMEVVTADPSSSETPTPSGGDTGPNHNTPPPLVPVDPALILPIEPGDPVRVVVTGIWINLPIVRPPLDQGDGARFPWCRIAEWDPTRGGPRSMSGFLFIYAHARYWEFERLLDAEASSLIGETIYVDIQPKTSDGVVVRRRYKIVEVREHVYTWADLADIQDGRVVLQTSETKRSEGPKRVVIGIYKDEGVSPLPLPTAKPQICLEN